MDSLTLAGAPLGGSIEVTIKGVVVTLTTNPGDTLEQMMAALVDAIERNITLAAQGVHVTASGDTLMTTGPIDDFVSNDPGVSEGGLPVPVPALSPRAISVLVAMLLAGVTLGRVRRSKAGSASA
jgi:hypothetical protein